MNNNIEIGRKKFMQLSVHFIHTKLFSINQTALSFDNHYCLRKASLFYKLLNISFVF